jgi:hypothetical protein
MALIFGTTAARHKRAVGWPLFGGHRACMPPAMSERIQSFEDFWPYYVSEHRDPTCRRLHFLGTSLAMLCAANPLSWPLVPVTGYGFAWLGHMVFEKNKPASFQHPLWSLRADLHMWRLIATGQLEPELARADELFPRAG